MKEERNSDFLELTEEDEKNLQLSSNPASYESLSMTMKELFRAYGIRTESVMPAQIVSYDRKSHVAEVCLLVKKVFNTTLGKRFKDRMTMTVPVLRMQHGLFLADAPLYPGDTGYVVAGHRDASLAIAGNSRLVKEPKLLGDKIVPDTENKGPQPPNTYLLHRYENGFFVPCRWGSVELPPEDDGSVVLARVKRGAEDPDDVKNVTNAAELVEQIPFTDPPLYETIGTDGKVSMKPDGSVHVVNRSGITLERDIYRDAKPEEVIPDKVTSDGKRLMKAKPLVRINPSDLESSDAKFREVVAIEQVIDESSGKVKSRYRKYRVLADEGVDAEDLGLSGDNAGYFSIYEKEDGSFSIRPGMVVSDDDRMLDVEEPKEPLDPTRIYCCAVLMKAVVIPGDVGGDLESAEIVSFPKGGDLKEEIARFRPGDLIGNHRWIVPIGSVDGEGFVTQLHTGAISLSNGGVLGIEAGDNVTITPVPGKKGHFKIDASGGGGGGIESVTVASEDGSVTVTPGGTDENPAFDLSVDIPKPPVTSVTGSGSGIDVNPTTGAVVVKNTGVTSIEVSGGGITKSASTGAVILTVHSQDSVNDGKLTLKCGTSNTKTFTANQSSDETFEVPEVKLEESTSTPKTFTITVGDKTVSVVDTKSQQTIGGSKTFSSMVSVSNANGEASIYPNAIYLKSASSNPWIDFRNSANEAKGKIQLSNSSNRLLITDTSGIYMNPGSNGLAIDDSPTIRLQEGTKDKATISVSNEDLYLNDSQHNIVLNAQANGAQLSNAPTVAPTNTTSTAIATCGWVVDKTCKDLTIKSKIGSSSATELGKYNGTEAKEVTFNEKRLVEGDGIKLTESNGDITISTTNSGSLPTNTIYYVFDVRYNTETHYFEKLMAHCNLSTGVVTTDATWTQFSMGAGTTPHTGA